MKILILSHQFYPHIGGIEMNTEILANYLYKCGIDIKVMTWSKNQINSSCNFPYPIVRNPDKFRIIKEHQWADLVFENNPCLKLSWPLLFLRKPHVVALHTWIQRLNGTRSFPDKLKLMWLNKANTVIAVSNAVKKQTHKNALVIENAYKEELFKRISEIEKTKDFVFLGRLVSDKGADMAIGLIKMLKQATEKSGASNFKKLTIVGDGPEWENLKSLVKENDITELVSFTGALTGLDLVEKLNEHKYILIPSRWKEPYGIVALEGIACGCIPIVSNEGGLPDAIGKTGIVFKRNNLESLYNQVTLLLGNPMMQNELRSYFKAHLKEHTSTYVSEKYLQIIRKSVQQYEQN